MPLRRGASSKSYCCCIDWIESTPIFQLKRSAGTRMRLVMDFTQDFRSQSHCMWSKSSLTPSDLLWDPSEWHSYSLLTQLNVGNGKETNCRLSLAALKTSVASRRYIFKRRHVPTNRTQTFKKEVVQTTLPLRGEHISWFPEFFFLIMPICFQSKLILK